MYNIKPVTKEQSASKCVMTATIGQDVVHGAAKCAAGHSALVSQNRCTSVPQLCSCYPHTTCCGIQEQKQLQAEAEDRATALSAELEGSEATVARLQQECSAQADEVRHQLQRQQAATAQVSIAAALYTLAFCPL